jgi:hypothetical protein
MEAPSRTSSTRFLLVLVLVLVLVLALPLLASIPFSFWKTGSTCGGIFVDPASVCGLKLWLKADALALSDGTAVSSWTDSSGNGNTATQATGANQPLFKTAIVNAKPVIRFDGTNDVLDITATLVTGPFAVFIARQTNGLPSIPFQLKSSATSYAFLADTEADGVDYWNFRNFGGPKWTAPPVAAWNITDLQWDGGGAATANYKVFINGSAQSLSAHTHGGTDNTSSVALAGVNPYNGDIAEIIVYNNAAFSATDRSNVETYLSRKYAIGRDCTYASDGDTNGVFYFAGQNFNSGGTWTNPYTASRLAISASSLNTGGDTVDKLVNRTADHCDTTNVASSYYTFDLGAGRSLVCNKMSFRFRPDDSTAYTPTGWLLQGSNDNSTYTTLLTVSGASPGLATWRSDTVSGSTAYRYFRVKQNGTNVNGTSFFAVGEIELYGTFTY